MTATITGVRVASLSVPRHFALMGELDGAGSVELDFVVWSIRTDDGVCLVDTGLPRGEDFAHLDDMNSGGEDRWRFRDVRSVGEALDDLGVAPAEVDAVLLTQLVTYCSGGLEEGLFPHARIVLARAGLEEYLAGGVGHPPTSLYVTPGGWRAIGEAAAQGRLDVVDRRHRVVPGVEFVVTGGHHPASASVRVSTDDGRGIALMETAFLQENVETSRPIGIAESAADARRAVVEARSEGFEIVAMHDPRHRERFAPR